MFRFVLLALCLLVRCVSGSPSRGGVRSFTPPFPPISLTPPPFQHRFAFRSVGAFTPAMQLSKVADSRAAVSMMARAPPKKAAAKKAPAKKGPVKSSGKTAQEGKGGIFPWITNEPGSTCHTHRATPSTHLVVAPRQPMMGRRNIFSLPLSLALFLTLFFLRRLSLSLVQPTPSR